MINEIKELVEFIEGSNSTTLKEDINQLHAKSKQLYNYLKSAGELDDSSASNHIYGVDPHSAYYNTRRRLHEALLLNLIRYYTSNENKKKSFEEIRDYCVGQMAVIRLIQTKGLFKNVIFLAERTLKMCLKYDFNDIAIDLLRVILAYYGRANRNVKKFKYFKKIFDEKIKIRDQGDRIQIEFYEVSSQVSNLVNISKEEDFNSIINIEELEKNIANKLSHRITFFSYNLLCMYYQVLHEYAQLHDVAQRAYDYMKSMPYVNTRLSMAFLQIRLTAEIKLNRTDHAFETFSLLENNFDPRSRNIFVVNIYRAVLLIHRQNYVAAEQVVQKQLTSKYFKSLPKSISEYIKMIQGYLVFLASSGEYESAVAWNFRLYKFLNEIPGYQKDKRGANISLLILHACFLLLNKKEDQLIDRVDALRLYTYRYLRKDDTFRSHCFIRLLIEMTKADFHPIRTERYTRDLRRKLDSMPLSLSEQPFEVEIVPYEHLWDVITRMLVARSGR